MNLCKTKAMETCLTWPIGRGSQNCYCTVRLLTIRKEKFYIVRINF